MSSIQLFVMAHMALIILAWPAATAVASLLYTLAESNPRIHAFLSVLASLGIDLPKVWNALGRLITGSAAKVAVFGFFVLGLGGVCLTACKAAESAVIQGVDAACAQLDSQPEPGWVYFTCAALDAAGNVIGTFTAKVPAEQAKDYAAKHPMVVHGAIDAGGQ